MKRLSPVTFDERFVALELARSIVGRVRHPPRLPPFAPACLVLADALRRGPSCGPGERAGEDDLQFGAGLDRLAVEMHAEREQDLGGRRGSRRSSPASSS